MDILLVEDSKTMRGIVQRVIRQAGFRGLTVGEAENGAQALEKLRAETTEAHSFGLEYARNVRHRLSDAGQSIGEQRAFWLHHVRDIGRDQGSLP